MNLSVKALGKLRNLADNALKYVQRKTDRQFVALEKWYADDPHSLRKSTYYHLTEHAIVFDLGGYEGQWTSDIVARYNCKVFIFEPVKEYFELIKKRFENNQNVSCFQFGLANRNYETEITVDEFASSTFTSRKKQSKKEKIQLVSFKDFIDAQALPRVDLLKINIEGGEYDLLENLIAEGEMKIIDHLLIQFHNFVTNADKRRNAIRDKLAQTHEELFSYEYIWEHWKLKS